MNQILLVGEFSSQQWCPTLRVVVVSAVEVETELVGLAPNTIGSCSGMRILPNLLSKNVPDQSEVEVYSVPTAPLLLRRLLPSRLYDAPPASVMLASICVTLLLVCRGTCPALRG